MVFLEWSITPKLFARIIISRSNKIGAPSAARILIQVRYIVPKFEIDTPNTLSWENWIIITIILIIIIIKK